MAPKTAASKRQRLMPVVAQRQAQQQAPTDGEGVDDAAAPAAGPRVWGDAEMPELLQNANDAQRDATASAYSTQLRELAELDAAKPLDMMQILTAMQREQQEQRRELCDTRAMLTAIYRQLAQPPPHLQAPGPNPVGLPHPFGMAGAPAAWAGTAAAVQHGHQTQPPQYLPGAGPNPFGLPDPFGLAGASAASAGTAAAGASWFAATSLRAGEGLGGAGNPSLQDLFQSATSRQRAASAAVAAEIAAACSRQRAASAAVAAEIAAACSRQRAASAAVAAEIAAVCSQHPSTNPGLPPPVPTDVPAAAKGGTKGGKKGHSLAAWPDLEGLHLLPGQKPWTKEPETLDDLFHLFYSGVKVGDRSIVPAWSTLYSLHGDKWYPANDTSLRKRMGELKHLHDTCIQDTAKLRSCTAREAAAFWTGKQREHAALTASGKLQALKVYWENIVNPLRKDSTRFAAYVAKQRPDTFTSPTKETLERKRGSKSSAAATELETAAPPPVEGPFAALDRAGTGGEQGTGLLHVAAAGPSLAAGAPVTAAPEGPPVPESLKKPPHSGHQMFVSHVMRTASVKLPEAVRRWNSLQPAGQEEWNQKCAAAKQAFKGAAAKKAL
ncbi:hypothetical protein PLESTF_000402700 [Pleodorina starrii]|nr:hypothetical protein PLESTF_000402700 [Pleodorina starrii]